MLRRILLSIKFSKEKEFDTDFYKSFLAHTLLHFGI